MKDAMIEATERDGVDPDAAYDVVRERLATVADSFRDVANAAPTVAQAAAAFTLAKDRIWVNEERTVMVRLWSEGTVEVARRDTPAHTWGPPVYLKEEVA